MVPSFFRLGALLPSESASLSLVTPVGSLLLKATVGAVALTADDATSFADTTRSVHAWHLSDAHAELLISPPQISLPPGMSVDGALAALWRVSSEHEHLFTLDVVWAPRTNLILEGPESGENLDAQAWTDQHTRVFVGLPEYEASTTYRPDGFQIIRPLAPAVTEIQCVCAWRQHSDDGLPLWYAVDRRSSDIVGDLALNSRDDG